MKSIKIFVFALISLTAVTASAQFNLNLTFGPQIPSGDFKNGYNLGLGAGVQTDYFISDHSAVGLGLGYYSFGSDVDDVSCAFMPITANYMYRMGSEEGFMPYLQMELGVSNLTVNVFGLKDSEMYFGMAPAAGFMYGLNERFRLTLNAKYNYVLTDDDPTTYIGVNLGFALEL